VGLPAPGWKRNIAKKPIEKAYAMLKIIDLKEIKISHFFCPPSPIISISTKM